MRPRHVIIIFPLCLVIVTTRIVFSLKKHPPPSSSPPPKHNCFLFLPQQNNNNNGNGKWQFMVKVYKEGRERYSRKKEKCQDEQEKIKYKPSQVNSRRGTILDVQNCSHCSFFSSESETGNVCVLLEIDGWQVTM